MQIDVDSLPRDFTLRADVAVIGSGPAGITVARSLASRGRRVMLVEVGGLSHRRRDDRELRGGSVGVPFPLVTSRQRAFAGTSGHWAPETGLRTRPLDRVDFEESSARAGFAWPFGREELESYYRAVAEMLRISPDYEPSAWLGASPATELAWPGGPELAVFQFAAHDVFVDQLPDVLRSRRIELLLGASVTALDVDPNGSAITRVRVASQRGNEISIRARVVVLACGTIENIRLLLDSPGRTGGGVGNEHDMVGRYFMDRISVDAGVLVPAPGRSLDLACFEPQRSGSGLSYQAMLWLGERAVREHGLLNAGFWLWRGDPAYLSPGFVAARRLRDGLRVTPRFPNGVRNVSDAARGTADLGRFAAHRLGLQHAEPVTIVRALGEQTPLHSSRVSLGQATDSLGRRRVVVDWRVDDGDLQMIRRHVDLIAEQLESEGVATISDRLPGDGGSRLVQSNYHHLGGTRMHVDARFGVVDADCRVHSVPNLFIAGGSVFPSAGYVNPTLTIGALALRVADEVERDLSSMGASGHAVGPVSDLHSGN